MGARLAQRTKVMILSLPNQRCSASLPPSNNRQWSFAAAFCFADGQHLLLRSPTGIPWERGKAERRGRVSNPGATFWAATRFPSVLFQPLRHLSPRLLGNGSVYQKPLTSRAQKNRTNRSLSLCFANGQNLLLRSPTGVSRAGAKQNGEGGIRTHEGLSTLPLFESGSFNHSDTSPNRIKDALLRSRRPTTAGGASQQRSASPMKLQESVAAKPHRMYLAARAKQNGGGRIRTYGPPKADSSFQDCPVRPLRHSSLTKRAARPASRTSPGCAPTPPTAPTRTRTRAPPTAGTPR